jgi:hypothetical protein
MAAPHPVSDDASWRQSAELDAMAAICGPEVCVALPLRPQPWGHHTVRHVQVRKAPRHRCHVA